MNSVCKTTLAIILLFAASIQTMNAQFKSSKIEAGIQVGTLVYQGDLSNSRLGDFKSLKPALGLYAGKTLDPYFSLRFNATFGKIAADELNYTSPDWKQYRAFNFSTSITEISSTLVFNPFGENSEKRLSPYIFVGAGVTFLKVNRDWSKYNKILFDNKSVVQLGLAIDTLHITPKVIPVLPVSAGLRYILSSQFSLNAEATYRITATDYIDGFKYAVNPNKNDRYYGLSVGLSYRFGGYRCPAVRR